MIWTISTTDWLSDDWLSQMTVWEETPAACVSCCRWCKQPSCKCLQNCFGVSVWTGPADSCGIMQKYPLVIVDHFSTQTFQNPLCGCRVVNWYKWWDSKVEGFFLYHCMRAIREQEWELDLESTSLLIPKIATVKYDKCKSKMFYSLKSVILFCALSCKECVEISPTVINFNVTHCWPGH